MDRKSQAFLALFGVLFIFPTMGWSDQEGTVTATFLNIGQGARAEGMGGAFSAIADDGHANYWNPAGLVQIKKQHVSVDHLSYFEDISSQYASYSRPVPKMKAALGVYGSFTDFGTIERRDANNVADGGDADVNAMSGGLTWSQSLSQAVSLGFGVKSFSQNLAGTKDSGFAGDAGLLVKVVPDRLNLAGVVSNFGPKIKVGTTEEEIPSTVRGGAAFYFIPKQWVVDLDFSKANGFDGRLHAGTEYKYQDLFILRAGYQDNQEAGGGLSFGAGFIWRQGQSSSKDFFGNHKRSKASEQEGPEPGLEVRFDYAYVGYDEFDGTHRIGVEFAF